MGQFARKKLKTDEENQFNQQVGALIENVRKIHNIEQQDFAKRLGISRTQLYFWESGEQRIPLYFLRKAAHLLSVPIEALMPGVTVPNIPRRSAK